MLVKPLGSNIPNPIHNKHNKSLFVHETMFLRAENKDHMTYKSWNDIPINTPIKLYNLKRVSSDYGMRIHPIFHIKLMHKGIDLVANYGTNIYATANGVVTETRYSKFGYGNRISIKHDTIYSTIYTHLQTINVKLGQVVKVGDKIGTLGSTGLSTGPHLHYEILFNNKQIDPLIFTYDSISQRSIKNYYLTLIALNT